ncbi:hypothetical protein PACTADRAFT_28954, partial [Pachysolen tannophilus NRRL Y-2460]
APIIDRILSDPITFVKAKHPDLIKNKPSSYITFSNKDKKKEQKDKLVSDKGKEDFNSKLNDISINNNNNNMKPKPKSMAEAVAAYTGKKFLTKSERRSDIPFEEEEEGDDASSILDIDIDEKEIDGELPSSDDADYQTADEQDSVEEEEDDEDEEDEVEEENEEDEEDEEDEDINGPTESDPDDELTSTPPTSPEEEEEDQQKDGKDGKDENKLLYFSNDDFLQIDENPNDRGSNGSKRIYKNWRELRNLKPLGLINQGVTCYMNAAIQALLHIPAVQHYLVDVAKGEYDIVLPPRSVSKTFAETSVKIWQLNNNGDRKITMINPKRLIKRLPDINCMMSEWQQEDSHEYFMSLMGRLQEDSTPKGHKLNESIIYDIFGGLLHQSVTCKSCGHVSNTRQEFYDLSLNLDSKKRKEQSNNNESGTTGNNNNHNNNNNNNNNDNNNNNNNSNGINENKTKQRYSVERSISEFFSPELIKTDKKDKSGYVCEKCSKRTNAIKQNQIFRSPETLTVHLKKFRFNGISSSKLKVGVSFPSMLDLTDFTQNKDPTRYQLIAVVVHEGRSVSSGHYIIQCRQPDGSWAEYDDEYINKLNEKEVLKNSSAYFLIYTRLT